MNKKIFRFLGFGLAALLALPAVGAGVVFAVFPKVPAPSPVKVEATPELLARGSYLAHNVSICMDCHSARDWSRFSAPVVEDSLGKGGEPFGHAIGLPGEFYGANITPAAVGAWSDGELISAFTGGVTPAGKALFPIMPWPAFAQLCERDVHAITAFVRSLAPIDNVVPERSVDFPVNLIVRTMPTPAAPPKECPRPEDGVAYGRYLTTVASCADCHTQKAQGKDVPGMAFAGGNEFPLPTGGVVRSANITPDVETGIGGWTQEAFIARFRAHADPSKAVPVAPGSFNTVMPWTMYGGMSEEDLGAIYDYLRTLAPVKNTMQRFTPAADNVAGAAPAAPGKLAAAE